MPTYKVAHIREQGQNMIIFPLASAFGNLSQTQQNEELAELQMRAHASGLAGSAVAVWQDGSGHTHFLGPAPWHGFLQSISYGGVFRSVNKTISW